jgi:WD40 repeat protein
MIPLVVLVTTSLLTVEEPPTYEHDIKPILSKRCTACHAGKNLAKPDLSGGLALDSLEAILQGTKQHKVIEPGRAADSELIRRLADPDEERRMPLMEEPLPADQQQLIARWIEAGASRGTPAPTTTARRRIVRSLDLTLPTEVKVPPKTQGFPQAGPVQVVLKVGPLPAVSALAFREDGGLLAVGTLGEVVVWDLLAGRPALVLNEIPGSVHALAFSRDGKRLAVGSGQPARSGSVRVYTAPDGTLLHDFRGHDDVVSGIAWRRDGAQLASASLDGTVRLWDLAEGRPTGTFQGHSDFVYDVAYAPDGRTVLSASKDRSIKRFDAATVKGLRTYSSHDDDVLAVAVRSGGTEFVTAGNEPQLRWWSIDKDAPTKRVGGHGGPVFQLAFSGDGRRLISASGDKTVRLWDGTNGSSLRTLPGPTDWQYAVALSHDGRLAAGGGWDGVVRVWDAEKGAIRAVLLQPPAESVGEADWLALSPSGYLVASSGLAGMVRWRVSGTEVPREVAALFMQGDRLAEALRGGIVPGPFDKAK